MSATNNSADHPAVWGGVPPRNTKFTGREDLLEDLRQALSTHVGGAMVLSGIGTTELAIEYVHRHGDAYDLIWWIPADTASGVRRSLATLAPLLKQPQVTDPSAVFEALFEGLHFPRWLLIYENAGGPSKLEGLLPGKAADHVLVSSRNADWDAMRSTIKVPSTREHLFVSYSHKDAHWLEELKIHLKALNRVTSIKTWDDSQIRPGSEWRIEIDRGLQAARAALLLISPNFLASDFIMDKEVVRLLEAAKAEGVAILCLIVRHSVFGKFESLSRFQTVNPPSQPLSKLRKHQRDEVFVTLTDIIERAFEQ